jgi:hypothetical protein
MIEYHEHATTTRRMLVDHSPTTRRPFGAAAWGIVPADPSIL